MTNNGNHPSRIGRYAVIDSIGHGETSHVYAALDESIGRRVAVRVGRAGDPRVHQQARMTGQVAHPNVVSVLDLGDDHGGPFAVMELLDGVTLDAETRPASLDRRLDMMLQVCDGLQAAHDLGVVHGAVKPGHVFLQDDGVVKLLDFAGDSQAYASPEQSRELHATERSDVFAAAATFHFLLTGRAPFESRAAAIADQPPAIRQADAPDALSRTLLKAMEKDPLHRHASINHLRAEIDQVRQGRQGDRQRILMAAFDRYRDIETLLDRRRALGRRLGLPAIEGECDTQLANLAVRFPEFARAGQDITAVGEVDPARAAEALSQLQIVHNEVAAAVAVLRAASGEGR